MLALAAVGFTNFEPPIPIKQALAAPRQRVTSAPRPARLVVCAGTMSSNDFKVGSTIELDGAPWRIVG